MSTKAEVLAQADSCLRRAEDDEPIFVLRASDATAASAVENWALKYAIDRAEGDFKNLTPKQVAKINQAHGVAADMRTWRSLHVASYCDSCGLMHPSAVGCL